MCSSTLDGRARELNEPSAPRDPPRKWYIDPGGLGRRIPKGGHRPSLGNLPFSRPRKRPSVATAAKGLSLHIGLQRVDPSHYEGWDGRLTAAEADANDLAEVVARATGYNSSPAAYL